MPHIGLDAQRIVDGDSELLFAPEIPLPRLHRDVPEEKLNLLQLAAGQMAQPSRTEQRGRF
jgi:hypothetical protein